MNYDGPRQREKSGRFDYTTHNDRTGTAPIGYCAGWREETLEAMQKRLGDVELGEMCFRKQEEERELQHKYHEDGHETAEGACACYKECLLDNSLIPGELLGTQNRCRVCDKWTQHVVTVSGQVFPICETHDMRKSVDQLLKVGRSIHS